MTKEKEAILFVGLMLKSPLSQISKKLLKEEIKKYILQADTEVKVSDDEIDEYIQHAAQEGLIEKYDKNSYIISQR